jgi:TPR repeat protein
MNRILCAAVVLSGALLSWPASAGMSEGVAAVTVGDYAKAIAEFQPLAAGGDPAAQYQLAKIYLEGHGPADGVPQGIDLMTKAANGNYPEAQAQLGLMYAMGLGVPVDNAKAYQWLNKAVGALPEGTRRTVAEANRDTVAKRMDADQKATAAAAPAAPAATTTQAAAASAAAEPAPQPATAKSTASDESMAKATTPVAATAAKTPAPEATPPKIAETANVPTKPVKEAAPAAATGGDAAAKAPDTSTQVASAKAPEPAKDSAAGGTTAAKAPDTSTQVASAKADATSAPAASAPASQAAPSGVRIQLISMGSETAAWDAWKRLSGKYSAQLSGLTPTVEPADLGDKGTFYRVQAGPFASVTAAQDRCSAMKQAGLDCLVVGKP